MLIITELTDLEREQFWRWVCKDEGCWRWLGKLDKHGYGRIRLRQKTFFAHRVSWIIHHGNPGQLCVLHRCDNPICVNPAHLFLGSHADNMADMMAKGRRWKTRNLPTGDQHWSRKHPEKIRRGKDMARHAKLTEENVREIRERYANGGVTTRSLGALYDISQVQISNITRRKTWKWVA